MDKHTDLLVVGAGVLGLATAFVAHERGQTVRVVDSDERPVGSSIQNFGHACFTGQADDAQDVADRARAGWLRSATAAGFWAGQPGTYIPAMTEAEAQVLHELAAHRGPGQVTLLSGRAVGEALGHPDLGALSGAHLPRDMRVDPREAVPRLARWLAGEGVHLAWRTHVTAVGDGVVSTNRGEYTADQVVVCPGFGLDRLYPEIAERHGVRSSTLVMQLIDRPAAVPADLAMLTGTSLTRYDAFTAMPSAASLRAEIAEREPDLVRHTANLMVTGLADSLLVGDSHDYSQSPEPFIDEDVSALLLGRATTYLGIAAPRVRQRWLGRYADSPSTNLVLEQPDPRTTVAVVTSGIGMTLSFGIAELALAGAPVPAR